MLRFVLVVTLGLQAELGAQVAAKTDVDALTASMQALARMSLSERAAVLADLEKRAHSAKAQAVSQRLQAKTLEAEAKAQDALADRLSKDAALLKVVFAALPPPAETPADNGKAATTPKPIDGESKDQARPPSASQAPGVDYENNVRPIFEQHCTSCHNAERQKGGLALTSYALLRQGGSSGEVIIPGNSGKSRLFRLASHDETPVMPPNGQLSKEELATLKTWIESGAKENRGDAAENAAEKPAPAGIVESVPKPANATPPMPHQEGGTKDPRAGVRRIGPIRSVAISNTAPLVAVTSENLVELRASGSHESLGFIEFPLGRIESVSFSRDGERLLIAGGLAGRSGGVHLIDVRSGNLLREFRTDFDTALVAALSPRQMFLAIAGASRTVRIYATDTGDLAATVKDHSDWVQDLEFSPDGNFLASGDRSGTVCISEAETGLGLTKTRLSEHPVHALAFRLDAGALAAASGDGNLRWLDLQDGTVKTVRRAHAGAALALDFGADGRLWSGGADGQVTAFSAEGRETAKSPPLGDWISAVAVDTHATELLVGTMAGELHRLDLKSLQKVSSGNP